MSRRETAANEDKSKWIAVIMLKVLRFCVWLFRVKIYVYLSHHNRGAHSDMAFVRQNLEITEKNVQ